MIEHQFEQRSKEWHDWRNSGIGASEIAAIMGDSPWMSSQDLWELKLGIRQPQAMHFAMQRGVDLEPLALSHYENMTGNIMVPLCASHSDHPFILASFDGISTDRKMHVEIKCPGLKSHELAIKGIVPRHYMWQIQQQLLVAGNNMGQYFSFYKYYPDQSRIGVIVDVVADPEMQADIIVEARKFQDHVLNKIPMYPQVWEAAARAWLSAQDEVERAQADLDAMREKLIFIANGQAIKGVGVSLGITTYKPKVDWDKFYETEGPKNPELEKYTSKVFDSKKFESEEKPEPSLLAPYLLPAKEPSIVVRKVNNAVDNAILEEREFKQMSLTNPAMEIVQLEKDALYDF